MPNRGDEIRGETVRGTSRVVSFARFECSIFLTEALKLYFNLSQELAAIVLVGFALPTIIIVEYCNLIGYSTRYL